MTGLALDGSVRLTGRVDDVRVPVAEATLCVVPIRQGSGTRLKILEAMALGTPVVSTSKGVEGLNVQDGEHFSCADTPADFAQATLALLADSSRRSRLAANARCLVEASMTGLRSAINLSILSKSRVHYQQTMPLRVLRSMRLDSLMTRALTFTPDRKIWLIVAAVVVLAYYLGRNPSPLFIIVAPLYLPSLAAADAAAAPGSACQLLSSPWSSVSASAPARMSTSSRWRC